MIKYSEERISSLLAVIDTIGIEHIQEVSVTVKLKASKSSCYLRGCVLKIRAVVRRSVKASGPSHGQQ